MLDQRPSAQGYRAPASVIDRRMVAWEKDNEVGQALTAITEQPIPQGALAHGRRVAVIRARRPALFTNVRYGAISAPCSCDGFWPFEATHV